MLLLLLLILLLLNREKRERRLIPRRISPFSGADFEYLAPRIKQRADSVFKTLIITYAVFQWLRVREKFSEKN